MKVKLDEGAYMPVRAHKADAGLDLRCPIDFTAEAGKAVKIDSGVHVEIPAGCVGMLKSKSGLNIKYGIVTEGVVDSGYTGSIVVNMFNHGSADVQFERGDKITQLVVVPTVYQDLIQVDDLDDTERGENGFGSSGR